MRRRRSFCDMLGFKLFGSGLNTLSVAAIGGDVGTSISAAGTNQGTATALTNALNAIATVATGAGVILYSGSAGDWQVVYNGGANSLSVYPPSGAQINALGTNNPATLSVNTGCIYFCMSTTQFIQVVSA